MKKKLQISILCVLSSKVFLKVMFSGHCGTHRRRVLKLEMIFRDDQDSEPNLLLLKLSPEIP